MRPTDYEILSFFLVSNIIGIGGVLLIMVYSFKRRGISYWNLLNPFSIFELRRMDYLLLAVHLTIMVFLLRNGYVEFLVQVMSRWMIGQFN